jgi:hypothetical protein
MLLHHEAFNFFLRVSDVSNDPNHPSHDRHYHSDLPDHCPEASKVGKKDWVHWKIRD